MNEQIKQANDLSSAAPDIPVLPLKPCCGNCRFTVPVPNDFLKVECHWGPPTPSMVAMPTGRPGQMGIQQMCSFPVLPRTFHCYRHERRLDG